MHSLICPSAHNVERLTSLLRTGLSCSGRLWQAERTRSAFGFLLTGEGDLPGSGELHLRDLSLSAVKFGQVLRGRGVCCG